VYATDGGLSCKVGQYVLVEPSFSKEAFILKDCSWWCVNSRVGWLTYLALLVPAVWDCVTCFEVV